MIMLTALTALSLPFLAAAQYGYAPPDPSSSTTTTAALKSAPLAPPDTSGQMNVDVAFQSTFTFHPANITAPVGTLVTFWFPNNGIAHSVTQSNFAAPCTYLAASSNSSAGFDSGLQTAVQFTINITDTSPIWFHCKQQGHCGMGMVGSINAPSSGSTFDSFQAAALAIGSNEPIETDNGPVTGGAHGVATAPPSAGSAGAGTTSGSTSSSNKVIATTGFAMIAAVFVGLLA